MNASTVMQKAAQEVDDVINALKAEEGPRTFIVKDLVPPYAWKRITAAEKSNVGTMFKSHVQKRDSSVIAPAGKTEKGQQKYKVL